MCSFHERPGHLAGTLFCCLNIEHRKADCLIFDILQSTFNIRSKKLPLQSSPGEVSDAKGTPSEVVE